MNPEQQAVVEAIQTMTAAFHAGDLDAVLASYAPGAAIAFEAGTAVTARAHHAAGFQQFFALQPRFTYASHEVIVAGALAIHFAPWTMRGTTPEGQSVERSGLSVAVLRRDSEGQWRIVIDAPDGAHQLRA